MNIFLFGRMLDLPIAARGRTHRLVGATVFTASDGRQGLAFRQTPEHVVEGKIVNMTAAEYDLFRLAHLYHPVLVHPIENAAANVYAWPRLPSRAQLLGGDDSDADDQPVLRPTRASPQPIAAQPLTYGGRQ